jgi:hypothetical protein
VECIGLTRRAAAWPGAEVVRHVGGDHRLRGHRLQPGSGVCGRIPFRRWWVEERGSSTMLCCAAVVGLARNATSSVLLRHLVRSRRLLGIEEIDHIDALTTARSIRIMAPSSETPGARSLSASLFHQLRYPRLSRHHSHYYPRIAVNKLAD